MLRTIKIGMMILSLSCASLVNAESLKQTSTGTPNNAINSLNDLPDRLPEVSNIPVKNNIKRYQRDSMLEDFSLPIKHTKSLTLAYNNDHRLK